jgi:hypothetical protein
MSQAMKRSFSFVLLLVFALAMAVPAFASTYARDYQFNYEGEYHEHSSGYIDGPAVIDDSANTVTLKLDGNYFPEIKIGANSYLGSYNASTGLTTFVIPGTDAANIDISLHVRVTILGIPVHDTWYDLEIAWL